MVENAREEGFELQGFREVVVRAGPHPEDDRFHVAERSNQDDGEVGIELVQALAQFYSANHGHTQVRDDHVRSGVAGVAERGPSVGRELEKNPSV